MFCYSILAIGCLFMSLVPVTKHGSQAMGNQNKSIVRLSPFFPQDIIFLFIGPITIILTMACYAYHSFIGLKISQNS